MSKAPLENAITQKRCAHCAQPFGPASVFKGNFKRAKVCSDACAQAKKKHSPEKAKAVFWARVDMTKPSGCWLYKGARDKWGYGDINYLGKHVQAHRLAWRILRGEPGEMDVLHTCHNPPCCNPEHLYLGTDKENGADRVTAGRTVRGEAMHTAKLTEENVREIRRDFQRIHSKKSNTKELAARYGVYPNVIRAVVIGKSWKHVR